MEYIIIDCLNISVISNYFVSNFAKIIMIIEFQFRIFSRVYQI